MSTSQGQDPLASSGQQTFTLTDVQNLINAALQRQSPMQPTVMPESIADVQLKYEKIGKSIRPILKADGSNFPEWTEAVSARIKIIFEKSDYFASTGIDQSNDRAKLTAIMVQSSIHESLIPSIIGKSGRESYEILKKRFGQVFWSYMITRWQRVISYGDTAASPDEALQEMTASLTELEKRLGGFTVDNILALALHQNCPSYYSDIANAIDSRMAVNPSLRVTSKDIFDLITRCKNATITSTSSVFALNRSPQPFRKLDRSNTGFRASHRPQNNKSAQANGSTFNMPDAWARSNLNSYNPCVWCFEWGHWKGDCPRRRANLPALPDPRINHPTWQPRRSDHIHPAFNQPSSRTVAAVQRLPPSSDKALIDSGATDSVCNDVCRFISLRPISLDLIVASADAIPVKQIGDVLLPTPYGNLRLSNVLYCPQIPGTIISLGKFKKWDGTISFDGHTFTLCQDSIIFPTQEQNDRCFLPVLTDQAHAVSAFSSDPSVIHESLGHLSCRMLRNTIKYNAITNCSDFINVVDPGLCESCAVMKAKHIPKQFESRNICHYPGDVVAADVIGPFPLSIDGCNYVLAIQDLFSGLVSAVPIKSKSDASIQIMRWISQFVNVARVTVKRLRTDNALEFVRRQDLKSFLQNLGIVHETTIPHEHHQNGAIERVNRTLSEMARTLLHGRNLPVSLWSYAFRYAAYVFNRLVHSQKTMTPYEIVLHQRPSLAMIRPFGCIAYLYDHSHRKQMTPYAKKLRHIGVCSDSKGWILWDDGDNKVYTGISVSFDTTPICSSTAPHSIRSITSMKLGDFSLGNEIDRQDVFINLLEATNDLHNDAPQYSVAIKSKDASEWQKAIDIEVDSLCSMDVFEFVDKPENVTLLGCRWILTTKRNQEGDIVRRKARLVAQGFRQVKGLTFEDTFAPTPTFSSLRTILTLCAHLNWAYASFDVTMAFLHSPISEDIYLRAPDGITVPPGKVIKLRKALYGTKQAGRCWWLHLKKSLSGIGFKVNDFDQSTYTYSSTLGKAMLWIHIDDGILISSSSQLLLDLQDKLSKTLKIKWDPELNSIVGIQINRTESGFDLHQPALIRKLLNLSESNWSANVPIQNTNLLSNESVAPDREYLSRIGILLYIAQATRPDISFAVHFLARFALNPDESHWKALNNLISYVGSTRHYKLSLSPASSEYVLKAYVDSNWGGEGAKSTHGFITMFLGAPIAWNSRRQTCVARSSCQAEYMALSLGAMETKWVKSFLNGFLDLKTPLILSDNQKTCDIALEKASMKMTRHIDREFHFINEQLRDGSLDLSWITTDQQLADVFTKALGPNLLRRFIAKIFNIEPSKDALPQE